MKEILNIIHKTIYQFFDVCEDDEEVPMSDKDKLLLEVNKAICKNLKALEQEPRWIPVSERLPDKNMNCFVTLENGVVKVLGYSTTQRTTYPKGFYYVKDGFSWRQIQNPVVAWMPMPAPYKGDAE